MIEAKCPKGCGSVDAHPSPRHLSDCELFRRGVDPLAEIRVERKRQLAKWGDQHHPDGTSVFYADQARSAKAVCDKLNEKKTIAWKDILNEEVLEAFCELDQEKLRKELIQVAAVAVAWIEDIDSRKEKP